MENKLPLCVDLDGTLIQSDLLVESFFQLLKQNIFNLILAMIWLAQGKAVLKSRIADRVDINPELLPYNQEFISFLQDEKSKGRRLILVTASHEIFAYQIAEYLCLFERVIATNESSNLSGTQKLGALIQDYGEKGFDYAGNARVDLKIWPHAQNAILVNPERGVQSAARKLINIERTFNKKYTSLREHIKAMRPHQWLKNVLLFLPLFVSHKWSDLDSLVRLFVAFISFSVCASSVYLLNDLMDIPEDRQHPRKRSRPFAAGTASVKSGALLSGVLLVTSVSLATLVTPYFMAALGFYYVITLAYSVYLKSIVLVDVFTLAGLYTMRIIAGAAAIMVMPSFWLLAFSIFIFLSLAMVKRFAELQELKETDEVFAAGRGYLVDDLETLNSLGASSGYLAALVLALYINSPDVLALYTHPEVMWLLCPLLLYWISRMWLTGRRGNMHDDPIIFALKDYVSRLLGAVAIIIILGAI